MHKPHEYAQFGTRGRYRLAKSGNMVQKKSESTERETQVNTWKAQTNACARNMKLMLSLRKHRRMGEQRTGNSALSESTNKWDSKEQETLGKHRQMGKQRMGNSGLRKHRQMEKRIMENSGFRKHRQMEEQRMESSGLRKHRQMREQRTRNSSENTNNE